MIRSMKPTTWSSLLAKNIDNPANENRTEIIETVVRSKFLTPGNLEANQGIRKEISRQMELSINPTTTKMRTNHFGGEGIFIKLGHPFLKTFHLTAKTSKLGPYRGLVMLAAGACAAG